MLTAPFSEEVAVAIGVCAPICLLQRASGRLLQLLAWIGSYGELGECQHVWVHRHSYGLLHNQAANCEQQQHAGCVCCWWRHPVGVVLGVVMGLELILRWGIGGKLGANPAFVLSRLHSGMGR